MVVSQIIILRCHNLFTEDNEDKKVLLYKYINVFSRVLMYLLFLVQGEKKRRGENEGSLYEYSYRLK